MLLSHLESELEIASSRFGLLVMSNYSGRGEEGEEDERRQEAGGRRQEAGGRRQEATTCDDWEQGTGA
eukprot:754005-Hanusia_phi.AAC.2